MERDLAADELANYVCPHLWPWVSALKVAGFMPSLARFDLKSHILTLEYPQTAKSICASLAASAPELGLEGDANGAVCRQCWQSLSVLGH